MEHAGDRGIRGRNADNDHADSLSTEKGDLKCDDRKLSVETVLVDSDWTASLRGPTSYFPRPLAVPIYASSTYRLENAREGGVLASTHATDGYIYTRWGNPTVDVAARVIAHLEEAAGTLLFSSGMSAIVTCLLTFLKAGDHAVMCRPCYGELNTFVEKYLTNLGVDVSWVSASSADDYVKAVKDNTKVLYCETPTNPTISLIDLEAISSLARTLPGVVTIVDATFASPYLLQPIKLGIDISLHSCTKYLIGHTDVIGGCVSYATAELGSKLHNTQIVNGPTMSPFDAFLLHRSLKTLAVRMDRHSENAIVVAEFLEKHSKVARVYYPGLPSHPQHELAKRMMKQFSGMISFELKGGKEKGIQLVESVKVIVLAVSLGGVESLIEHPASMTHYDGCVSPEVKRASGISDALIRLSVGIENVDDLVQDLAQALDRL